MDKNFSAEQKLKLTQIINEGMQVMHEIETLNGGLSDTIKAVAEELEIKPSILKKGHPYRTQGRIWQRAARSFLAGEYSYHGGQDFIITVIINSDSPTIRACRTARVGHKPREKSIVIH